ncbi:GntR family transcriptional regulator [Aureimonas flava]|uniref:GntR family transcriptional regulator n=1 Tax=Aureimonas flava TaxID=2320271 RepID=A0A3A1WT76_9HYPH|nr:GntR family transcriptional regulator [Aureimonas flava]RIY00945.1 GntR family transcriptional regulator [Aureimonas flava]
MTADRFLDPPNREPAVAAQPRRLTSATQVFEALRADIVSARLAPGTPLADRGLVDRFGVSRTPVREALIRLAEIGLVDVRPQFGTFVSRVPVRAIPEAVLIRKALEGVTVDKAAERVATGRLDALERAIRRQKASAAVGDNDGFHEADEAFHAAIADLAGHPGIWTLLLQAKVQLDRARRLTLPILGRAEQVVVEHEAILRAIAAGDRIGARTAMEGHLGAVIPDLAEIRARHPDYFI